MRTILPITMAAAVLLTASACGVPGESPAAPNSAPAPASVPATAPASAPVSGSAAPGSTPPPASVGAPAQATPADPGQPVGESEIGVAVATRSSSSDAYKVDMRLYPVKRNGATSTVNFSLTSPDSGAERVRVYQLLTDGNSSAIDSSLWAADGLQLIEGKNSKVYLVASDGQGQCLCSRNLIAVFLEKGNPVLFSASFAAPPADVNRVDVKVPGFGTVNNVPVE